MLEFRRRRALAILARMLVEERKQVVDGLPDPAGRRSPTARSAVCRERRYLGRA
jgi:hypothetical protein